MRVFLYCISFCGILILAINIYIIKLVDDRNKENQKGTIEEMEYYYLQNTFNYLIQSENASVEDCTLYYSKDTNKINLSSLLLDTPKLIFRISGNMCSPCVKFGLQGIEKILNDGKDNANVLIITSDMTFTEKERLLGYNYYSLSDNSFLSNLQVEEYSIPFFFMLDNTMKVRTLFVPEKTSPWYTEKYLLEISRILNENKK